MSAALSTFCNLYRRIHFLHFSNFWRPYHFFFFFVLWSPPPSSKPAILYLFNRFFSIVTFSLTLNSARKILLRTHEIRQRPHRSSRIIATPPFFFQVREYIHSFQESDMDIEERGHYSAYHKLHHQRFMILANNFITLTLGFLLRKMGILNHCTNQDDLCSFTPLCYFSYELSQGLNKIINVKFFAYQKSSYHQSQICIATC